MFLENKKHGLETNELQGAPSMGTGLVWGRSSGETATPQLGSANRSMPDSGRGQALLTAAFQWRPQHTSQQQEAGLQCRNLQDCVLESATSLIVLV